jgi:hypothetical protein
LLLFSDKDITKNVITQIVITFFVIDVIGEINTIALASENDTGPPYVNVVTEWNY